MTKYKLLRDLPWINAWEVIHERWTNSSDRWYNLIINHVWEWYLKTYPEWFEEIQEAPKTVHDLKGWEYVYSIIPRILWIQRTIFAWSWPDKNLVKLWLIFLTEQEAKNAIIRMETSNREDKFIPKGWDEYWYFDATEWIVSMFNCNNSEDILIPLFWLAFQTKEECKNYMTDEVKEAFWYTY